MKRLHICLWLLFAAVLLTPTAFAANSAMDELAMQSGPFVHTPLTMAKMRKVAEASANLRAVGKQHPEIGGVSVNIYRTYDQTIAQFKNPHVKKALADAGLTPRQYIVLLMCVYHAKTGVASEAFLKKMGIKPDASSFDQHNVDFWKAHKKEIQQLQQKYAAQSNP